MNRDFTKYRYQHYENAINIGWNNDSKGIRRELKKEFMEKLKMHCENPINVDYNGKYREVIEDGKKMVKGFGEIRILDLENDIRYAAPNIIYDNIQDGVYLPPDFFIKAVINSPLPSDKEYKKFMERYNSNYYWGEPVKRVENINHIVSLLENNDEMFRECMQEKNNMEIVTSKGSLLNYAIIDEKEEEAKFLIDKGIDINLFDGIELLSSLEKGLTEIAEILIDNNILMDSSEMNVNPLVSAIRFHNNFIARKLIKLHSELIVTYSNEFVRNCTLVQVAKRYRNEEIIKFL